MFDIYYQQEVGPNEYINHPHFVSREQVRVSKKVLDELKNRDDIVIVSVFHVDVKDLHIANEKWYVRNPRDEAEAIVGRG